MKILGSLLIAIALLGLTAVNADARLVSKSVSYHQGDAELNGYLAYDDSIQGKRPGVLVIHEWWGLNEYIKRRADMLAQLGFVAFAADIYGKGKVTQHPKEAGEWSKEVMSNIETWRDRAKAGLEVLKKDPNTDPARIAAIGFCFGGSTVQQLAFSGAPVKGVVSFHGSLVSPPDEQAERVKVKFLIEHGSSDHMVTSDKVKEYIEAMNRTNLDWRLIINGGAEHSFTNPDADKHNLPGLSYNKAADMRSWADMQMFFKEIFISGIK